ncbi:hypothetical protein M405DRAFT_776145 [Rhizopogon salebrosus TDB-379]|nr:hypothetical protein M405DRAFT_776145 [Rhizopogon salebrosus TDB-379]
MQRVIGIHATLMMAWHALKNCLMNTTSQHHVSLALQGQMRQVWSHAKVPMDIAGCVMLSNHALQLMRQTKVHVKNLLIILQLLWRTLTTQLLGGVNTLCNIQQWQGLPRTTSQFKGQQLHRSVHSQAGASLVQHDATVCFPRYSKHCSCLRVHIVRVIFQLVLMQNLQWWMVSVHACRESHM